MIRLLIKGDRFQASAMSAIKGIPFMFETEKHNCTQESHDYFNRLSANCGGFETTGTSPEGYIGSVLQWFREPSAMIQGKGYPAGVLLWYRSDDLTREEERDSM